MTEVDDKARLFVAVEVPTEVRDAIDFAMEPLRRSQPDVRWIAPSAFHLTVAFLGWCDTAGRQAVEAACAQAAATVGSFGLSLTGAAATFGSRVLWVELAPSRELDTLASALRAALGDAGMRVEARPFHAHITVARAGRGARLRPGLAQSYDGPELSWSVERLVLMRSRLRRTGALYSVESAWPLDVRDP